MQVLLTELVARAQAIADMHDAPITPAQWEYWATQENLALALFIARSGWQENISTQSYTVTGSEAGVFVMTNAEPLALVAIHESNTNGVRLLKYRDPIGFLRQLPGQNTVPATHPKEYRVLWDQDNNRVVINFYPEPSTGTILYYSSIPQPKKLSFTLNDATHSTSVNYPMGWEEYIVLGMAKRALMREESDVSIILMELQECRAKIEEACWNRNLPEAPAILNTDADRRGWYDKMLFPPPYQWYWF